jgi:hypothetical protein
MNKQTDSQATGIKELLGSNNGITAFIARRDEKCEAVKYEDFIDKINAARKIVAQLVRQGINLHYNFLEARAYSCPTTGAVSFDHVLELALVIFNLGNSKEKSFVLYDLVCENLVPYMDRVNT